MKGFARRQRSVLGVADALRLGFLGLKARPGRSVLSALGISLGIAAAVAVLGISASSEADLLAQLGAAGNLLTVGAGQTMTGTPAPLPSTAAAMIRQIPPVQSVTATAYIDGASVRRTAEVPAIHTGGISVVAAEIGLPKTLDARLESGTFLTEATIHYPAVVLGAVAANVLGINAPGPGILVYVGHEYFTVVGILQPVTIAPEIDQSALIGFPMAESAFNPALQPTQVYLRSAADEVPAVSRVLPFTANPAHPETVRLKHPSDVLEARAKARTQFTGLFLGLGAVAVLVGSVGIANTMVIAVLERRREIGLRRALGARRSHVAAQFMIEAIVLSLIGGACGVLFGGVATLAYAAVTHQQTVVPAVAPLAGIAAALAAGSIAGIYPAYRAARLEPSEALRSGE
ncbi:ABC transporter permease [Sinomonas sp. G460-2]|uniref:ABC transporter permease n=1 Tax=Sinomonas sp. G460-2 TaxID=3393464 RepID=UPI0039F14835